MKYSGWHSHAVHAGRLPAVSFGNIQVAYAWESWMPGVRGRSLSGAEHFVADRDFDACVISLDYMERMTTFESSIYINSLRLHARHGVLPQERVVGNDYVVTLKVDYDISRAMTTDDVADTINYALLCSIVEEEMAVPSNLIEHVAGRISRRILSRFDGVTALHLSITKANPPMGADCDGAGVEIHLTNNKN